MNELIKITTNEEGKKLVSARELHEFLESKERFSKWWEKVSSEKDYGFENGIDYTPYQMVHPSNNQEIIDYVMGIEMSKEISMISKLPKGKEARKYFINCEKKLIEISRKASLLEAIYNGGQEGILASKQLTELEVKEATTPLLAKIEEDKPLVDFAENIVSSSDNIQVGDFAKIIKDENIKLGRNKLYEWLRENKYIMKDNKPYQNRVDQGLFLMDEYVYNTPYKKGCIGFKTLISPKGQIYLMEKLKREFI